jgi:molybdopterin molybdotransferase
MTETPGDVCFTPGSGMLSYADAVALLVAAARPLVETEEVGLDRVLGRVTAAAVTSPLDVPPWDNSAMDGYAVRAADAPGEVRLPVSQRVTAGTEPAPLAPGTAARIFTGAPVPPGADAVVVQEKCRETADGVALPGAVTVGANIRPRGNDIRAGDSVIAAGERLTPAHLGLAASVGRARLAVTRPLRVALFSTGDELVSPGDILRPGQIYNSNRPLLMALLQALGCRVADHGIVPDDFEATREALARAAAESDLVLTSGGVSVGEEDHVKRALEALGELALWRVRMKPGKPLAYGRVGDADFLGLPGNPVSSLVTFVLFARPFLLRRMGVERVAPRVVPVVAGFSWGPGGRREFLRARLVPGPGGSARAELFPRQGSDVLSSAAWAEGLVEVPEETVVEPGQPVGFLSFAELFS